MTNQTQLNFVKNELKTKGYITRNECLAKFISRLGALINKLKNQGWEFDTSYIETPHGHGKDYKYTLKKAV